MSLSCGAWFLRLQAFHDRGLFATSDLDVTDRCLHFELAEAE